MRGAWLDQCTREDADLAMGSATSAGRILREVRASCAVGASPCQTGDRMINAFLGNALREHRPDDGLLSEEERDTPERLKKRRDHVWRERNAR